MSSLDFDNDVFIYDYKFRYIFKVYLGHELYEKSMYVDNNNIDFVYQWYKERLSESYDIIKDCIGPFEYKLSKMDDKMIIDGYTNQNEEESFLIKSYLLDIDDDGNEPLTINNNSYIVVPEMDKNKIIEESFIKIND